MIEENRRLNVSSEVARGDSTLESAELLLAAGKAADAVSRAYYAAFHYARALLLTLGEEPITHAEVEKLLHRHWVRTGAGRGGSSAFLQTAENAHLLRGNWLA